MKVVIGIDDSKYSDGVIDHISGATWPKDTKFIVLSALHMTLVGVDDAAAPDAVALLMEGQKKYHMEIAKRAAARLRESGLTAEARTVVGDPRTALLEAARSDRADLIVVGSHGRTGIKKLLLGSVAHHVVTHAPCSVLVVRREGSQPG